MTTVMVKPSKHSTVFVGSHTSKIYHNDHTRAAALPFSRRSGRPPAVSRPSSERPAGRPDLHGPFPWCQAAPVHFSGKCRVTGRSDSDSPSRTCTGLSRAKAQWRGAAATRPGAAAAATCRGRGALRLRCCCSPSSTRRPTPRCQTRPLPTPQQPRSTHPVRRRRRGRRAGAAG
jgi:hypothetical protein